MKLRPIFSSWLIVAFVFAGTAWAAERADGASRSGQESATVAVDCDRGQSINRALERHPRAQSLIVEIAGRCTETVVVTRDRVTLRGNDPAQDGIVATSAAEVLDSAVWVRGAHLVTLENLSLEGGFAGLLATEASTGHLRLLGCRLTGNTAWGALLQASLVQATGTVFEGNGSFNAGIFQGSRLECLGCTFANPLGTGPLAPQRMNAAALGASTLILTGSTLSGGGVLGRDAIVQVTDSALSSPVGEPSFTLQHASSTFTRVELAGQLRVRQGSNLQLAGVVQTRAEAANTVSESSILTIVDASPAAGGPPSLPSTILATSTFDFSNVSLQQTSRITGDLRCNRGSDAFCANPTNVSGVSTCGLCPKP